MQTQTAVAALAVSVIIMLVAAGCAIAVSMGSGTLMSNKVISDLVQRSQVEISLNPAVEGSQASGNLQGLCIKSCRRAKASLGKYFQAFGNFSTIIMLMIVGQILLNLITAICTLMPYAHATFAYVYEVMSPNSV